MEEKTPDRHLIVYADRQQAELWEGGRLCKTYPVSTAKNGAGCAEGSYCTPAGKLRVAEKIGEGLPAGAVLKSREPTGEIWTGEARDDDLILTRILWLEGGEEHNRSTRERYIYLHGTNHEDKLGTPASHGCIRFSNRDIIEVFDRLAPGATVEVRYDPPPRAPAPRPA